ncbi:Purple acid phosphatase 2 [Vitis vinifera]|uniref:acid phosphatase n=1 Tax=Vitis vinifera TaxID=29760 RepID=A0A438H0C2_VITVI|nr:Purple acid phosphatase 2 [Vitis vinifera]
MRCEFKPYPCYVMADSLYKVGIGNSTRQFWFGTPPRAGPDVPYTFGLTGILVKLKIQIEHLLTMRWDTWGRFTERSAAYQPWIWTAGNHEIDFAPDLGESEPFKPYTNRYHVPFIASASTSPLWYSIKRASAYIIVMSSYSGYGKNL